MGATTQAPGPRGVRPSAGYPVAPPESAGVRLFLAKRSMRLGSPSPQPFSAQAENPDATDAKLKSEPMDSAEAKLPSEATEPMEANDPAEPIDSTEPVEPMERIDPLEPIDRIDPDEPMLRMEPPALPAPEELTLPMKAFWHRHRHRHRPGSWSAPGRAGNCRVRLGTMLTPLP